MKLHITNDDVSASDAMDVVKMTGQEFNAIQSHPYIRSGSFDTAVIDTDAGVRLDYVRELVKHMTVIPKIKGDRVQLSVNLLSTLYQDKAADLKVFSVRDVDKFNELVQSLATEYHWKDFY